ncbi:MAG TPA: PQQ-dependent sugar dehydrogenase [Candidatus Binatia bacterium]|nr:PQQ-dependent sugar dehydrogenase [Candidatus Binatia bacterium]
MSRSNPFDSSVKLRQRQLRPNCLSALREGLKTLVALIACSMGCTPSPLQAQAPRSPTPPSVKGVVDVQTVAKGLEHPWSLAFLPDQRMLVTERPGRLRLVGADGRISEPLAGVPQVYASGQGGLLDVALSPTFAKDRLVYLSFAESGEGNAGTAVARGRLGERGLENTQVIWRQQPKVSGSNHWGSRIVFRPDGTLFVTLGERFNHSERSQDLTATIGKVVRINPDGSAPRDNPFVNRDGARPEIWSYGHRNVQAAALHPETAQLWTVEHGARGGDELNHPEAGKNYGWPVISYGTHYSLLKIGEGTAKPGMEQPVYYWDPVIAPSGMVIYTGNLFSGWKNDYLIGSLTPGGLVRLVMKDGKVAQEERYLGDLRERIRDVRQAPDGSLYLLTDARDGQILRITPAAKR